MGVAWEARQSNLSYTTQGAMAISREVWPDALPWPESGGRQLRPAGLRGQSGAVSTLGDRAFQLGLAHCSRSRNPVHAAFIDLPFASSFIQGAGKTGAAQDEAGGVGDQHCGPGPRDAGPIPYGHMQCLLSIGRLVTRLVRPGALAGWNRRLIDRPHFRQQCWRRIHSLDHQTGGEC